MGDDVTLVNSGAASARLIRSKVTSTEPPEHLMMVSDIPRKFQTIGERFLGYPLPEVRHVVYRDGWVMT